MLYFFIKSQNCYNFTVHIQKYAIILKRKGKPFFKKYAYIWFAVDEIFKLELIDFSKTNYKFC